MSDAITRALSVGVSGTDRARDGLTRLAETRQAIERAAATDARGRDYLLRVAGLLGDLIGVLRTTNGVLRAPVDVALLALTRGTLQAGRTGYQLLADDAGLTGIERSGYARTAARLTNALCLLATVARTEASVVETETLRRLRGASNCSSTGGGDPPSVYADVNTLEALFQRQFAGRLRVSTAALAQIAAWSGDPLSYPAEARDQVYAGLTALSRGIVTGG